MLNNVRKTWTNFTKLQSKDPWFVFQTIHKELNNAFPKENSTNSFFEMKIETDRSSHLYLKN